MNSDQQATLRHDEAIAPAPAPVPVGRDVPQSLPQSLASHLPPGPPLGPPRYITRAPGRLNIMGGFSGAFGCLALNVPITTQAYAGAQRRADGMLSISAPRLEGANGAADFTIPFRELLDPSGKPCGAARGRELGQQRDAATLGALGAIVEGLRAGVLCGFEQGVSIAVGTPPDACSNFGRDIAMTAAVFAALHHLSRQEAARPRMPDACRAVHSDWLQRDLAPGDIACVLGGRANTVLGHREPNRSPVNVPLQNGVQFIGLDGGHIDADATRRRTQAHRAALMGQEVIARIVAFERGPAFAGLSSVTVEEYVQRFRDRLPTCIAGGEFIAGFGSAAAALGVESRQEYRLRSRTEHHIYEQARSTRMVTCLDRAAHTADFRALIDAGEQMYASHWSYGQRCGLASQGADLLVNLVRKAGPSADLYGARISGMGCADSVTVLMRRSDRAHAALEGVAAAYAEKTGRRVRMLSDSTDGALHTEPLAM